MACGCPTTCSRAIPRCAKLRRYAWRFRCLPGKAFEWNCDARIGQRPWCGWLVVCWESLAWLLRKIPTRPLGAIERFQQAGNPQCIAPYAGPSINNHYGSYWVGGGSLFADGPRQLNEGTWGWDYRGILFPKQVALGWTHGRRYQGGTGAYRTVGPSVLRTQ